MIIGELLTNRSRRRRKTNRRFLSLEISHYCSLIERI
jgi:hypothetical protein